MSDNERDCRPSQRDQRDNGDLYNWSGDSNGNNGPRNDNSKADLYAYDGSGKKPGCNTDETPANDHVPANWHPDYSLSSPSAQQWFKESQQLRKQKLDLDENGDHVVQHGDSLWTIAERELHDNGKQGSREEIKAEMERIAKLNERLHPSLMSKPDFIGDGWKLHIEPRCAKDAPPEKQPLEKQVPPPEERDDRCVPKDCKGEVTPPGYQAKPSVIVNNVYTDNAYFDQRGGNSDRPDRCLPNRGDDVFRYSGDNGRNNGDLYRFSGDGRGRQDDLYAYSGDGRSQQRPNDLYAYSGDRGGTTGDDGTSYYPGAGSAQDQLWDGPPRGRQIINNVYAENAYFDQRGGSFDSNPNCRIMQRDPCQSGEDNYYNCKPRGRNHNRIVPMYDNGDYSYQPEYPQYPQGNGRTDYYTYNGNARNQGYDYYSSARSQQGYNVNGNFSSYRNPSGRNGRDDEYAY